MTGDREDGGGRERERGEDDDGGGKERERGEDEDGGGKKRERGGGGRWLGGGAMVCVGGGG